MKTLIWILFAIFLSACRAPANSDVSDAATGSENSFHIEALTYVGRIDTGESCSIAVRQVEVTHHDMTVGNPGLYTAAEYTVEFTASLTYSPSQVITAYSVYDSLREVYEFRLRAQNEISSGRYENFILYFTAEGKLSSYSYTRDARFFGIGDVREACGGMQPDPEN